MLTAKREESDKVVGLEWCRRLPDQAVWCSRTGGAGSCPAAASAGLGARRCKPQPPKPPTSSSVAASKSMSLAGRSAAAGREVELTDQEFRLLHLLITHPGIVFSREALLTRIWRGDTFRDRAQRRPLVATALPNRARPREPGVHPHGLGRRIQVRRMPEAMTMSQHTGRCQPGLNNLH